MPVKPSSSSESEKSGQHSPKKARREGSEKISDFRYDKKGMYDVKKKKSEEAGATDTFDERRDFEEGLAKLRASGAGERRGIVSSNKGIAPAFYPKSLEERESNLEANWDLIEQSKIEEEKRGPPFGRLIDRYLSFSFKKK